MKGGFLKCNLNPVCLKNPRNFKQRQTDEGLDETNEQIIAAAPKQSSVWRIHCVTCSQLHKTPKNKNHLFPFWRDAYELDHITQPLCHTRESLLVFIRLTKWLQIRVGSLHLGFTLAFTLVTLKLILFWIDASFICLYIINLWINYIKLIIL